MSDRDLPPGTPVTRLVSNANGSHMETRHGVVVRKLRTRYLIRWTTPATSWESSHIRIPGSRSFQ